MEGAGRPKCTAANGVITHKASSRSTSYGKVAEAAAKLDAAGSEIDQAQGPEGLEDRRQAAQAARHPDKITGKQVYGDGSQAARHAQRRRSRIARCSAARSRASTPPRSPACRASRRSCKVGDTGVAVVADTWWQAKTALEALPIVWDEGENAKVSSASIAEWLKEGLDAEQAFVGNQNGDAKAAIAGAAKKVEAVYAYPYQNHATMEPMNATALYTADKCEVWAPTQNGEAAFAAAVAASGLPGRQVRRPQDRSSAAASAGAAPSTTTSARPSSSPSRCRARR